MFTNLIESDSHSHEFKRRSSFFFATVAAYALVLSAAGVASIYAYDAHLEAQSSELEILSWVPQVEPPTPAVRPAQPIHRSAPSNAPVDRNITESVRTAAVAPTNNPVKVPESIGTTASNVPPVTGAFRLGNRNVDPPSVGPATGGNCVACNAAPPLVRVDETPPTPPVVKPPAVRNVSQGVLIATAISLPQPAYPAMAKQIRIQGPVTVQILVNEEGRVISAQTMSGHPMLVAAAKEAALRARFTTTKLSGVPVKVQGLITYNFVLQ